MGIGNLATGNWKSVGDSCLAPQIYEGDNNNNNKLTVRLRIGGKGFNHPLNETPFSTIELAQRHVCVCALQRLAAENRWP